MAEVRPPALHASTETLGGPGPVPGDDDGADRVATIGAGEALRDGDRKRQ